MAIRDSSDQTQTFPPHNKSFTRVMLRALRNTQVPNLLKHFSTIARDDPIHRVNLRVGKVVNVEKHPGGEHLFIEQGAIHTSSYDRYVSPTLYA